MEPWRFAHWRARLKENIRGTRTLEAGIGTDKNINHKTIKNIRRAGWQIKTEAHLSGDIVRWIVAQP